MRVMEENANWLTQGVAGQLRALDWVVRVWLGVVSGWVAAAKIFNTATKAIRCHGRGGKWVMW